MILINRMLINFYSFFILTFLSDIYNEVDSLATRYAFSGNEDVAQDRRKEDRSPPPLNQVQQLGNYKTCNNAKKAYWPQIPTTIFESNIGSEMLQNKTAPPLTRTNNNCMHNTSDIGKSLEIKYKMSNSSNDEHECKANAFGKLLRNRNINKFGDEHNLNKMLNLSDLQDMLLPLLNEVLTKVLYNMTNQENKEFKGQEAKKRAKSGHEELYNTKNRMFEDNAKNKDYVKILERYLSEMDGSLYTLLEKNNSLESSNPTQTRAEEMKNKKLIEGLMSVEQLIDKTSEEHNHRHWNANGEQNNLIASRSTSDYNHMNQTLEQVLDSVLKEIILKDIANNSQDNIVKNLEKLIYCNASNQRDQDKYFKSRKHNLMPHDIESEFWYPDKIKNSTLLDKDCDKYYSHNIVQLSEDRKDKEFPLELVQSLSHNCEKS